MTKRARLKEVCNQLINLHSLVLTLDLFVDEPTEKSEPTKPVKETKAKFEAITKTESTGAGSPKSSKKAK